MVWRCDGKTSTCRSLVIFDYDCRRPVARCAATSTTDRFARLLRHGRASPAHAVALQRPLRRLWTGEIVGRAAIRRCRGVKRLWCLERKFVWGKSFEKRARSDRRPFQLGVSLYQLEPFWKEVGSGKKSGLERSRAGIGFRPGYASWQCCTKMPSTWHQWKRSQLRLTKSCWTPKRNLRRSKGLVEFGSKRGASDRPS
jgi:hypothetical protein